MIPFSHRRLRRRIVESREPLYRLAWSWCHDSALADDLVQETQERALAKFAELRDDERLQAWLFRILVNRYRDHLRARREATGTDSRVGESASEPEETHGRHDLIARTRAAVARLGDDQREVLTLVDLGGVSYAEAAQILDLPIGTVMSRLARARGRLKVLLQRELSQTPTAKVVSLRRRMT
jgi:RNA polymerase sigma-70 factor (ECF subfamily)